MTICFFCKRPVPGDCVLRISVGMWIDKDFNFGHHGPELCFHMECARDFAHRLLEKAIDMEPRGRRRKLKVQLEGFMENFRRPEPDYAKPPKDWWRKRGMKKPASTFTIEVEGGSTIIGISPGRTLTIALGDGKVYSAPITWVHQTMARKFARENPTGRKRRRFFSGSEEMRKYLKEHPEEMGR